MMLQNTLKSQVIFIYSLTLKLRKSTIDLNKYNIVRVASFVWLKEEQCAADDALQDSRIYANMQASY